MSETYNGWANVETWRVQLHLANDEGESNHILAMACGYIAGDFPRRRAGTYVTLATGEVRRDGGPVKGTFSEAIRDRVERSVDRVYKCDVVAGEPGVGFFGGRSAWEMFARDVVDAALARVDWEQIAAHWLRAARDEVASTGATGEEPTT